jgi:hypothetical protein
MTYRYHTPLGKSRNGGNERLNSHGNRIRRIQQQPKLDASQRRETCPDKKILQFTPRVPVYTGIILREPDGEVLEMRVCTEMEKALNDHLYRGIMMQRCGSSDHEVERA